MRLQPERRNSLRIITLKNAGWLALSLIVLLIAMSAFTRFRSPRKSDHHLLYDQKIGAATPSKPSRPPETVSEASPGREIDASRREKFLTVEPVTATATEPTQLSTAPALTQPIRLGRNGGGRVVISGGSDGVRVDVQPAPRRPHS
ncbi:MAG TPA: hypothetical protein VGS96_06695 [Thermoanaerobaculia bacterium]|jgi:hypothetical protein|nr:hypothetical protein [Thermoanaerobaculia bacterium]